MLMDSRDAISSRSIFRITVLAAALASFTARGLKLIDAFPFKSGASNLAADHYHGSLPLFLDHGFSVLREDEMLTVVRKMLG